MNIDDLDLKQLKELRGQVDKAIVGYEDKRRRDAVDAIKAAAQEHGFALADLVGSAVRTVNKVSPKYAHPENPEMTWTGRGRKPKWVEEHLASGKSLDDLLI